MRRTLVGDLAVWKESPDRKPLILKGMRQCGKTWLLRDFGREYYADTAYFNFEGNEPLQARFEGDLDARRIISELGILRKKAIEGGTTLIIFDEIQFCNRALSSLKYFCENAPEYHIAAAGSLLGIALSRPLSFPVGKVDMLELGPMNFYEFLLANGEGLLCDYLDELPGTGQISELFAEKLEQYLKIFYIIGGMPEAVANWLAHRDFEKLDAVQQKILDSYELDFAKHAPTGDFPKLEAIWRSIPGQLARENSKFIFSQVKRGLRARDLEDALEWLISAGLVYKVAKIEKPFMPLSAYADQSFFKIYLTDTGLLRKMSGLPPIAVLEKSETYREFKGALTENYALGELVRGFRAIPFYWRSENTAEVDFIIQNGMDIVPIEVKSEKNTKAKSLAEYLKRYKPRLWVKSSMNGAETKEVPLYMLWKLKKILNAS